MVIKRAATVAAVTVGMSCSFSLALADVPPSRPDPSTKFSECSGPSDTFCIESLSVDLPDGSTLMVEKPGYEADQPPRWGQHDFGLEPWAKVQISPVTNGDGPERNGTLSVQVEDLESGLPEWGEATINGIRAGTYRLVIRTGDFDPSWLQIKGEMVEYEVTERDDGTFLMNLVARPLPITTAACCVGPEYDFYLTCIHSNWHCTATTATRRYLGGFVSSYAGPRLWPTADEMRGTWTAGNAAQGGQSILSAYPNGPTFVAQMVNPHFVPDDFGLDGLTVEEGRGVFPAYYETFFTYRNIATNMGALLGREVSPEEAQVFAQRPGNLFHGTIEVWNDGKMSEVPQELTVTPTETGVRVNFNLEHYSAPNPKVLLLNPLRSLKRLANGTTINVLRGATRGRTYTWKTLLAPSAGSRVTRLTSGNRRICSVSKSAVRMLRPGRCILRTSVVKGKRTSTTTVSVVVR